MVCLDKEVALMENGVDTLIGSSGVRLSGGQAQRLALARTICHKKPVIILDDPFSALDKDTEKQIFKNLGEMVSDSIVMIISHRLYLFPQMNKVIWLNDGKQRSEAMMSLLKSAVNMRCFTMDRMEAVLVKNNENVKAANSGKKPKYVKKIITETILKYKLLSFGIVAAVCLAVVFSLIPPLILGKIIDMFTAGQMPGLGMVIAYFAMLFFTGLTESAREGLLTVFGQKITHAMRSCLMEKFTSLTADELNGLEPGSLVSRFIGDVDMIENLFTSGIISMFADACKIISILVVIWFKNKGLTLVFIILLPFCLFLQDMCRKICLRPRL